MAKRDAWKTAPRKDMPEARIEIRHGEAVALAAVQRDPYCQRCPFGLNHTGDGCLWGDGPVPAAGMVIYEQAAYWDIDKQRPLLGQVGGYFDKVLEEAGLDRVDLYVTNAIKCKSATMKVDRKERAEGQKQCASYLDAEIRAVSPKVILAMGESAFYYFTHKPGGITTARGEALWSVEYECWVIFTVSPMLPMTAPAYSHPFIEDVRKFSRYLAGRIEPPQVEPILIRTTAEMNAAMRELFNDRDQKLTFDLETRGFISNHPDFSKVWCAAFTRGRLNDVGEMRAFLIPLEHPDSPFLRLDNRCEPEVVRNVLRLITQNNVNGHNILFDLLHSYCFAERYGIDVRTLDTEPEMLDEALEPARSGRVPFRLAERARVLAETKALKPKQARRPKKVKESTDGSTTAEQRDGDAPVPAKRRSSARARRKPASEPEQGGADPAGSGDRVGDADAAGRDADRAAADQAGDVAAVDRASVAGGEPGGSRAPAGAAA